MNWMERALQVCAERGISQATLARACKVEPARITEWKKGNRGREPYARQVYAVAEYLGVSLDWLLSGHGSTEPQRDADLTEADRIVLEVFRASGLTTTDAVRLLMSGQKPARVVAVRTLGGPSQQQPESEGPAVRQGDGDRGKPGRK